MKLFSADLLKSFEVSVKNPDGETEILQIGVRQATEGDNIERNQLFAKTRRVYNDGVEDLTIETDYNVRSLRRKEAYLTLGSVTGIWLNDEETIPAFRSKLVDGGMSVRASMNEGEFNKMWNGLPPHVARAISDKVMEANPDWTTTGG